MKNTELERSVYEFRLNNFKRRYHDASLSKIDYSNEKMNLLNSYLKKPKNMLILLGNSGTSKTYFCSAIVEWMFTNFYTRRYHKEDDLLASLRNFISEGSGEYLKELERLTDDAIVILDDVASSITPGKVTYKDFEWRREIFFHFLDSRYNSMLPTIITSNLTPPEFKEIYSQRIYSRLFATENTIITLFGDEDVDKRSLGM